MTKITAKDIESFGKVLAKMAEKIQSDPSYWLQLLTAEEKFVDNKKAEIHISDEVENINIFDAFKDIKRSEIIERLNIHTKDELRFLIKKFNLGVCRSISVQGMAEFISDQILKRSQDVFINQN